MFLTILSDHLRQLDIATIYIFRSWAREVELSGRLPSWLFISQDDHRESDR